MKWIKCSERLPEFGACVLISPGRFENSSFGHITIDEVTIGVYSYRNKRGDWWYSTDLHFFGNFKFNGSWMPLPDPPEVGG